MVIVKYRNYEKDPCKINVINISESSTTTDITFVNLFILHGFCTRLDCGRLENRVLIYQRRFVGVNLTGKFIRERSNDCGGLDLIINDPETRRIFDVYIFQENRLYTHQ